MKNIESFDLFELNRVGKYYQENPDAIYHDNSLMKAYQKEPVYLPNHGWLLHQEEKVKKLSLQSGISVESLVPAINSVFDYKVKNTLVIPKMFWKTLRKLTVKPNNIPTLWRGVSMGLGHGTNPHDFVQRITNEIIIDSKAKCISWSTSRDVAMSFMKGGSHNLYSPVVKILLKYTDVPYNKVIVDTRELKNLKYANEHEVILEPSAQNFTIDQIFANKGYTTVDSDFYKWVQKHHNWKSAYQKKHTYTGDWKKNL